MGLSSSKPTELDFVEGKVNEPNWNSDAVDDLLEDGEVNVKNPIQTPFISKFHRTGRVTRKFEDYLIIDNAIQFSTLGCSASEMEALDLKMNDMVRYTMEDGKCIKVEKHTAKNEAEENWDDFMESKKDNFLEKLIKERFGTVEGCFILKARVIRTKLIPYTRYSTKDLEVTVDLNMQSQLKNKENRFSDRNQILAFLLNSVSRGGPVDKSGEPIYLPESGDFVQLTMKSRIGDSDEVCGTVVGIEPVRWQSFEGSINRVGSRYDQALHKTVNFAIVENEIYVPFDACLNGYNPLRNDWVSGTCFECQPVESCEWRAINMFPRPQSTVKPRSIAAEQSGNLPIGNGNSTNEDTEENTDNAILGNIGSSGDIHFGQIILGQQFSEIFSLVNTGENTEYVESVDLAVDSPFKLDDKVVFPLEIGKKSRVDIEILCKPTQVGIEKRKIQFNIGNKGKIVVYAEADAISSEELNFKPMPVFEDKSNQSVKNNSASKNFRSEGSYVVPGGRPQFKSNSGPRKFFIQKLPAYEISERLKRCLEDRDDVITVMPFLSEELSFENYSRRFQGLLHLEEFAIQKELDRYMLQRVCFGIVNSITLSLKVPGLQEQRPSLLVGDKVYAHDPHPSVKSDIYEGNISEVRFDDVLVLFNNEFTSRYNGEDYNITFAFNRTPMRRCHQSVERAEKYLGRPCLFPTNEDLVYLKKCQTKVAIGGNKMKSCIDTLRLNEMVDPCNYMPGLNLAYFNELLNNRQRLAVLRIVEGLARPIPYILYGPPGTGKTVTLVEVILQLYIQLPNSRILVCAPSNSAADLLLKRIHFYFEKWRRKFPELPPIDMCRLNAAQRIDVALDDPVIQKYSLSLSDIYKAVKHRILVSTCITAGQMNTENVKIGSFTHVIVDEAGHATEPEVLVPVSFVDVKNGQIVLAGDPKQLGPILESRLANIYGLQMSLLERLTKLPIYKRDDTRFSQTGGYNPMVVTKLVNNYRSHPKLFEVSSKLFYDNELEANAPNDIQNLFVNHEILQNKEVPMIVHSVQGRDLREGSSMSWFNCHEVMVVIRYLRQLDLQKIPLDEIGVITPYKKQIEKLRLFMERAGLGEIKVGTVEEFQGQERSVIILSVVRSTEMATVRAALGFLSNPKRMNVAMTRAKSLLIVVANCYILLNDPSWSELVRFAVENSCCVTNSDDLSELKRRLTEI